ncbi:uncharacterized protein UHOD_11526 [Ustilago sp. UG-2017b]|nr:uncharacterized protein UHOD_11526 [Ustilago sp. UG-2017b]
MPPSTRAGQTGRDDDQAAAATGNGREEGWLTQVVRILQLANPALTAEEAIVRAMGLVSISGQTPRGEMEKIPKDVSSSITHIQKLSNSNWHTWEPTFIDCLQREYDEDLDKALVGLIHACCDNSPDSRIDTYTVRGADEEVQLGSMLYAKLKKALTQNDAVKRARLQDRIHKVRLHNRDVVRLGKELDSIWNDAARLGKRFDEDLVRGLAPETRVGLSRYSVTIKLCDSYCLGIGLDELRRSATIKLCDDSGWQVARHDRYQCVGYDEGGGGGDKVGDVGGNSVVSYARRTECICEEGQAHMRGGPSTAKRRTKLKEHADACYSGIREIGVKGIVAGRRRRNSV